MSRPTPSFYNLAWRWHFYAGLFVAPFMILLALTGIIYLFKPQLDPLLYDHLLTVTPAHHGLSADEQLSRVQTAYPQGHISQYLPPINRERSGQFVLSSAGRELNVFINPYTGQILGEQDAKLNLQAVARALHGELMIGTLGDRLVELAAGWGVVLVVSGLFLWWPRGQSAAGILWPRLNRRGRVLWRDLHVVTGFWGAALLLFMLISGMTWTGFWGKQYADLWNRFPVGHVERRAQVRYRGPQPQQRHPPDRTLGNGKHTDAGLRRPRRTYGPRRPQFRPRSPRHHPASRGRHRHRAPGRTRLQHHPADHRQRRVYHSRVRRRPAQ
ncbi:MAG: hypothetical protein ACFWUJ_04785 [Pseudomonas fragi]